MAVDKLVDSTQIDADLTSIANAIRTKGGTSGSLAFPSGFVSAVQAIPTGITPAGTKQISIAQNGTTTEDVAAYANAEITVNVQGGGGSSIQLLGTITVPSDTRAVSIDTTPYNSYDFYFCIIDATLTASDWLYVVKNGSSPSDGYFQDSSITHHGLLFEVVKLYSSANKYTYIASANGGLAPSANDPNNMYVYTYAASKLIKADSTFKIYGGNYADM